MNRHYEERIFRSARAHTRGFVRHDNKFPLGVAPIGDWRARQDSEPLARSAASCGASRRPGVARENAARR
jgi:hypothetical protein